MREQVEVLEHEPHVEREPVASGAVGVNRPAVAPRADEHLSQMGEEMYVRRVLAVRYAVSIFYIGIKMYVLCLLKHFRRVFPPRRLTYC